MNTEHQLAAHLVAALEDFRESLCPDCDADLRVPITGGVIVIDVLNDATCPSYRQLAAAVAGR